jgi:hypothetical protein
MRKYAVLAAAATMALAGTMAHADFVTQTTRSAITTGVFAGDELVTLQVEQAAGTLQSGTLIEAIVSLSSTTPQPQFFIRTWSAAGNGWDTGDNATPGSNADFGNTGVLSQDASTPRTPAGVGSNVKFAGASNTLLATTPSETATTYTDKQSVAGFTVTDGIGGTTGGAATTFKTLAQAVVPVGQQVTFAGTLFAHDGTAPTTQFAISDPAVPEPASLAVIGFGAVGVLSRRRRTA